MAYPLQIDADSITESPIQFLESQGLLLNIFNHLEGLDDFVRCTCVSKSWRAIVDRPRGAENANCSLSGSYHVGRLLESTHMHPGRPILSGNSCFTVADDFAAAQRHSI